MALLTKFAFDTDFAEDRRKSEVPRIDLAEHGQIVAAARLEAEQAGYQRGHDEAEQSIARAQAIAFTAIGDHIARAFHGIDEVQQRLEAEAIGVAMAAAKKLAGQLIEREPLEGIRALVADCLANLRTVPHLVVRVGDALFERAQVELSRLAQERGYAGRLVILAESSLLPGDARIEWASGGIVVDRAETERRVDEAVARFLAAGGEGAAPHTHQPREDELS